MHPSRSRIADGTARAPDAGVAENLSVHAALPRRRDNALLIQIQTQPVIASASGSGSPHHLVVKVEALSTIAPTASFVPPPRWGINE